MVISSATVVRRVALSAKPIAVARVALASPEKAMVPLAIAPLSPTPVKKPVPAAEVAPTAVVLQGYYPGLPKQQSHPCEISPAVMPKPSNEGVRVPEVESESEPIGGPKIVTTIYIATCTT